MSEATVSQLDAGSYHQEFDDEIDLVQLWYTLLSNKWLVLSIAGVIFLIGLAYAELVTPIYEADALIQVEEKRGGFPGLEEISDFFEPQSNYATEIEVIKSRLVLDKVIADMKLNIHAEPKRFPIIGGYIAKQHQAEAPSKAWLYLDSYGWGGEEVEIAQLSVPPHLIGVPLTLVVEGLHQMSLFGTEGELLLSGGVGEMLTSADGSVELLVEGIHARAGTQFRVFKLSNRDSATQILSNLTVAEQGRGTGIIAISLRGIDPQRTQAILRHITSSYQLQNVERLSQEVEKSLQFLQQQLPKVKSQLEDAEQRLNEYRLNTESVDMQIETESMLEQMVAIEARLNEFRLKEVELSQRYRKEHPLYATLLDQKQSVQIERDALTQKIQSLPDTQQEMLRLRRDVEVGNQIYLQLLNKTQKLDVVRAGTIGNIKILGQAEVKNHPVAPKKMLIALLSLIGGLITGVMVVFVKAMFNKSIKDPTMIEDQLGLPIYAVLPYSKIQQRLSEQLAKAKRGATLLALYESTDLSVEGLRSMRTSLHFAMLESKNNIIAITSPGPGAGKSFVSSNLAAVLAQADKKVLLIDGDLRKGQLHRYLGLTRGSGLSDYLVDDDAWQQGIRSVTAHGLNKLSFMSTGSIPPNPSELLISKAFSRLLDKAATEYELVLIDTPPVLAVTDATLITKQAGTTLLVARHGISQIKEIELTVKQLGHDGVKVNGVIYNALAQTSHGYYGNYYYYSYKDAGL